MYDYQMFRTVRMKGFDRDEVIAYIQSKDEEFSRKAADLEKTIDEKDRMIEELKSRLMQKDAQRVALENEIETKYKKYIENYDKIGALVYESQVKGDQMVADAKAQADKMVGDATREADRLVSEAQAKANQLVGDATAEADQLVGDAAAKANKLVTDAQIESDAMVGNATEEAARIRGKANEEARTTRAAAAAEVERELSEGKQKYSLIQGILNDTVEMINQVQKRFMSSYKDVHELVADVPSEKELADQVDRKISDEDDFDDVSEEGVSFETGELNFDLSEALLDSEDEELDEIPAAYREAAEEPAAEEAEVPAEPEAEEPAAEAPEDPGFQAHTSITEDLSEAARAVVDPAAESAAPVFEDAEEMAAQVASAIREPDVRPLEDEAEAFFRGASV